MTCAVRTGEKVWCMQAFADTDGRGNLPVILPDWAFEGKPPIPFESQIAGFNGEYKTLPRCQNRIHSVGQDELSHSQYESVYTAGVKPQPKVLRCELKLVEFIAHFQAIVNHSWMEIHRR